MSRPSIGDKPMTVAERKARSRAMAKERGMVEVLLTLDNSTVVALDEFCKEYSVHRSQAIEMILRERLHV